MSEKNMFLLFLLLRLLKIWFSGLK